MKENILWDLDGTLTNPKLGITRCIQHALSAKGVTVPETDELLWCIGPPLNQTFAQLAPGSTEEEIKWLIEKYRQRFAITGMFENEVYSGIDVLLDRLSGKQHFVATSKPQFFAKPIVAHFKLDHHFKEVYGSELDGERGDKGELIRYLLDQENIDPKDAVMIGDRKHDMIGAKKAGLTAIGITWGFGARKELEETGADHIFDDPKSLGEFLSR